jgi:hypothetical protein
MKAAWIARLRCFLPELLLFAGVLLLMLVKFHGAFMAEDLPNWDAPGHHFAVEKMAEFLSHGRMTGYVTEWFGGFPLFQFYGPLLFAVVAGTWLVLLKAVPLALLFRAVLFLSVFAVVPAFWFFVRTFVSPTAGRWAIALGALFVFYPKVQSGLGMGAGAVLWAGLVASAAGLALALLLAASLERLAKVPESRRWFAIVALTGAGLALTHLLSLIFGTVLSAAWAVSRLRIGRRGQGETTPWARIASAAACAFGLAAFWLVPLITTLSYSAGAVRGNAGLGAMAWNALVPFRVTYLPVASLLLLALAIAGLVVLAKRSRRLFIIIATVFALFALSGPISRLFPGFSLHYYRFLPVLFLLEIAAAASAIAWVWESWADGLTRRQLYLAVLGVFLVGSFFLAFDMGVSMVGEEAEPTAVAWQSSEYPGYGDATALVSLVRQLPSPQRVHVEMPMAEGLVNFGSLSHFARRLPAETGVAFASGLYQESGPLTPYLMPVLNMMQGGLAPIWGQETLRSFSPFVNQPLSAHLRRLGDLGVDYLAAYSDVLKRQLTNEGGAAAAGTAGPFALYRLEDARPLAYAAPNRPAVFLSAYGGPTFREIATALYGGEGSYALPVAEEPRRATSLSTEEWARFSAVIVDGRRLDDESAATLKASGRSVILLNADEPSWEGVTAIRTFEAAKATGDKKVFPDWLAGWRELQEALAAVMPPNPKSTLPVTLDRADGQTIRLRGDGPTIVNFAYFPYWQTAGGADRVYRVTPERMLVFAKPGEEVVLVYGSDWVKKASVAVSLATALALAVWLAWPVIQRRRQKKA